MRLETPYFQSLRDVALLLIAIAIVATMVILGRSEARTTATTLRKATPSMSIDNATSGTASIVLGGGCFWCVEAVFKRVPGVVAIESGYAGGTAETANYKDVSTGKTNHAEVIKVAYDPAKVTLDRLLEIHFNTHDPTTLNRQGADVGTQYRSAVFFADDAQKSTAEKLIAKYNTEKTFRDPVVTTVEKLDAFYPAEAYHQNYAEENPGNPYIQNVSMPKVKKVEKFLEKKPE